MKVPHIFVVEDEEINRTIIVEYFEDMTEDYIVETAVNGRDAWEKLQEDPEKFDVILLDRMMPEMDGMELLVEIKGHPVLNHLPVIFQTALSSKADVAEGMAAGAHYYLTKPFDINVLRSIIRTAVRDRMEYRRMTEELTDHFSTMMCLNSAQFSFRTVQEGKKLAVLLANTCNDTAKAVMGLTELLVNGVEHGNLGITYHEKGVMTDDGTLLEEIERRLDMEENKKKLVDVVFSRTEDYVEFTITDEGAGFDWKPYLIMSPERASDNHGRGIAMASLMSFDELEYIGCGNTVKAKIKNHS